MKTYGYKIQIAPSLYQQLGLERLSFLKEQEAIDVLTESFIKAGMAFAIKEEKYRKAFVNETGGELAVIVSG